MDCDLVKIAPEFVERDGFHIAVYRAGEGPVVLLLHGFPALSLSLRHQFSALVEAGYQCVAIDQRGFGASDCPQDVDAYSMSRLRLDVVNVMDFFEIKNAYALGHDWGGSVAWQLATHYPNRIKGVISLSTFLFPRTPNEPIAARRSQMGDDNYVVFFQTPGKADDILNADIGRTIDFMFRQQFMTMDDYPDASPVVQNFELLTEFQSGNWPGIALLSDAERRHYVDAFERTTFTPGINWYRNITQNWIDSEGEDRLVHQPSLLISGKDDYFAPPFAAPRTHERVANLQLATVAGGHWFPLETPRQTNRVILDWLSQMAS